MIGVAVAVGPSSAEATDRPDCLRAGTLQIEVGRTNGGSSTSESPVAIKIVEEAPVEDRASLPEPDPDVSFVAPATGDAQDVRGGTSFADAPALDSSADGVTVRSSVRQGTEQAVAGRGRLGPAGGGAGDGAAAREGGGPLQRPPRPVAAGGPATGGLRRHQRRRRRREPRRCLRRRGEHRPRRRHPAAALPRPLHRRVRRSCRATTGWHSRWRRPTTVRSRWTSRST
ncbi:hypothetical protein G5V59_18015 [Nocardioides sp. W3-2-3]|uniref:hypothetical protein n=1 Tax=Nocardioides convexus TaxID=2712224 RepID=UPI0024182383|nr:hypothetical protein [Nocardioides convexus]NHA01125.1 hypothetical protein [Nocardioides convexus]